MLKSLFALARTFMVGGEPLADQLREIIEELKVPDKEEPDEDNQKE